MAKERVFITWSGERSKAVARALRDWLPLVVQQLDPWMSDKDLSSGARWFDTIGRELERARAGVMCVTPENRQSPWLHFEAGALAKQLDAAKVCPYLLGMKRTDLEPPLSEFQAVLADEPGTLRLVQALNTVLDGDGLTEGILEKAFKKHWPDLKAELDTVPSHAGDAKPHRSDRELLEEVLSEVRSLKPVDRVARDKIAKTLARNLSPTLRENPEFHEWLSFVTNALKNTDFTGSGEF